MRHAKITVSESVLNTNLNVLAHDFVREMAMAAKKVAIYGPHHQVAQRAIERPFLICNSILYFKKYINLNVQKGNLYVLNIQLRESVFTKDIIQFMQILDSHSLLFNDSITQTEFAWFIDRFVRRVKATDHANILSKYLAERGIESIEVNTEKATLFFESQRLYRGDVSGDFSVRGLALQQLGDNLEELALISRLGEEAMDSLMVDFHPDIVKYLLPEKITTYNQQEIRSKLLTLARKIQSDTDNKDKIEQVENYRALTRLVDYHPHKEQIIFETESELTSDNLSRDFVNELVQPTGKIQLETGQGIDGMIQQFFTDTNVDGFSRTTLNEFSEGFGRLLKTGQSTKAINKINELIDLLGAPEPTYRQRSLALLECCVRSMKVNTDILLVEKTVDRVVDVIKAKKETFEYSQFLWLLLENNMLNRRFHLMSRLTSAMAQRRTVDSGVTIYESMAIKQAFANLNRKEVIDLLIDELVKADHKVANQVRELLTNIGSEEVAMALTSVISHPERAVRQNVLKIMAALGKPAVKVCSQIIFDDCLFEREQGRYELPDPKWYVVRNAIFSLGLLADTDGMDALRLRLADKDIRVRREIVSTLEKIGGEDACDLLFVMASDSDKEICVRSINTIGLIGTPDMSPLIIDLARRHPELVAQAVSALGKLGGEEARLFLVSILNDDQAMFDLIDGQISKDDLRVSVAKALGSMGDGVAISKLREYKANLSSAQKLFFKNSALNRTISEILARY